MTVRRPRHAATPQPLTWLTPRVRIWAYGVALTTLPLLIAYGILAEAHAPLWAALAGAILVPGMAIAHTPKDNE